MEYRQLGNSGLRVSALSFGTGTFGGGDNEAFRSLGANDLIGYTACAICVSSFSVAVVWSRAILRTERAESVVVVSGLVAACAGLIGMA